MSGKQYKVLGNYRAENGNAIIVLPSPTKVPPNDVYTRSKPPTDKVLCDENTQISFGGGVKNCKLIIGGGAILEDVSISFLRDGGVINFHGNGWIKGAFSVGLCSQIEVGEFLWVTSRLSVSAAERTKVMIGDDCMFGSDVQIMSSDLHPIFDSESRKRVNFATNVVVGEHVWLASGCTLLKGAYIGDNSIVGAQAVVTGQIPNNCVAAGNPAKVVKQNVNWAREQVNLTPIEIEDASYLNDLSRFIKTKYNGEV